MTSSPLPPVHPQSARVGEAPSLQTLPEELILNIASHLSFSDLAAFSRTAWVGARCASTLINRQVRAFGCQGEVAPFLAALFNELRLLQPSVVSGRWLRRVLSTLHLPFAKPPIKGIELLRRAAQDTATIFQLCSRGPLYAETCRTARQFLSSPFCYEAPVAQGSKIHERRAVILAAQKEAVEVMKLLLHHKADIHFQITSKQDSPINWAAFNGSLEMVELLLQHGAEVNRKNVFGWHTLSLACMGNINQPNKPYVRVIQRLIAAGASVTEKDRRGRTPLHHAAFYGISEAVPLLLKAGADVNARASWRGGGGSVLGGALDACSPSWTNLATIQCLVEHGANLANPYDDGRTASQVAAERGLREIAEYLRAREQLGNHEP